MNRERVPMVSTIGIFFCFMLVFIKNLFLTLSGNSIINH